MNKRDLFCLTVLVTGQWHAIGDGLLISRLPGGTGYPRMRHRDYLYVAFSLFLCSFRTTGIQSWAFHFNELIYF
jgi:hypothetical protein